MSYTRRIYYVAVVLIYTNKVITVGNKSDIVRGRIRKVLNILKLMFE